jgi:hypothetical protein
MSRAPAQILPCWLRRRALETEDTLRYHPVVRGLLCRYHLWRGGTRTDEPQALARALVRHTAAARMAVSPAVEAHIQDLMRPLVLQLAGRPIDWTEFVPSFQKPRMNKAAILKPCLGPREKGVVFISFENQWVRLLKLADLRGFASRYTLVVAPSGSPHNLVNYLFPACYPDSIFTLISNPRDPEVLPRVAPNLVVVPLYASSWVNPASFEPVPRPERKYDLIMVANFAKFKRHQALFAALRGMPRTLRLLLIGQDQDGRTAETIHEVARWYGVADRFELRSNQDYREVTRALCRARASVVLSRREGSCVVIAESLFADAPAALLHNAEIGSRVFLNEETGRLLEDSSLAPQLTAFVAEADRYCPRAWAEANISCFRSSQTLNDLLRRHALAAGQEWTQDIAPLHWCPDPRLVHETDWVRLAPERAEILKRFDVEIGLPGPAGERGAAAP